MSIQPDFDKLESSGLTEREFGEIYADILRASVPNCVVTITGPLMLLVQVMNEQEQELEAHMNLETTWRLCKDQPGQRVAVLEAQISKLREVTSYSNRLPEDLSSSIVPLLRRTDELDQINQRVNFALVVEQYSADLSVAYGINTEHAVGYLTAEQRKKIELTDAELRLLSLENLTTILDGQVQLMGGPELWAAACGRDYESSLLLNVKLMKKLSGMVKGRLIVAVPARDMLCVCGEDSTEALEKMKALVQNQFENAPHPISRDLYLYENDGLTVF
jgi:uncharacterized protein YtpQ (UPF0354 family)